MKVIVAGCRNFGDFDFVLNAINEAPFTIEELVSGGATGVDYVGETLAREHGIEVTQFPADWQTHGKRAGPIRNRQMAQYADALIAIWDGKSAGTKNMIDEMKKLKKPVHVVYFER